jgi:hypothetical protein
MSTAPKDFCEGCTCGRAEGGGLAAPEQYAADARDQRSFTAPLDTTPSEGIEPAVPLRSNMWFNNPEDGQFASCVPGKELIYRYGWMLCRAIPQQRSNLYVHLHSTSGVTDNQWRNSQTRRSQLSVLPRLDPTSLHVTLTMSPWPRGSEMELSQTVEHHLNSLVILSKKPQRGLLRCWTEICPTSPWSRCCSDTLLMVLSF